MAQLCPVIIHVNGKLVRCGGEIKPVIMCENGNRILYDVCQRCNQNQSLTPVVLSDNILREEFEVEAVYQNIYLTRF